MKPDLLIRMPLADEYVSLLAENFAVHYAPNDEAFAGLSPAVRATVRAVLVRGPVKLTRADIETLPRLELIHNMGAGVDSVDLVAARDRNIAVSSGSGTNASSVADHAMGLTLAMLRNIPASDAAVRTGGWPAVDRPLLTGKRIGILGLGEIGMAYARRVAGFDTTVFYHNRKPRADVAFQYCASAGELAAQSDIVMIAAPGGEATLHLVNAEVLSRLGPQGYLVNVGRGSIVDTAALAEALQRGTIAGAGLDVFEGEPKLPEILRNAPNLVLTPHMAGRSLESIAASGKRATDNLLGFFAGLPLLGRVI
ncbi:MAG TPA: 2-hydroxyacid dehydrogenase [Arsenicitalea sp.]|jgi:lactate dehydrogenase-like 2-hydroxyacid dehydrogenase|nr:2-hydroxyacid dehydrogenase [Arsenicitalea sp.]